MRLTAFGNEKIHGDGRFELIDRSRIEASPLYNKDLAPVPVARRTWTTYNTPRCGSRWRTASRPTCSPRASWPPA